jgi:hypothetical protein
VGCFVIELPVWVLTSSWLRSVRNFLLDGVHIISLPFLVADIIMAAISAKFALHGAWIIS